MIYDFATTTKQIGQSDIFSSVWFGSDEETRNAALLTPECDLVIQDGRKNPKASFLLFAGIIPFDDILNSILSSLRITKGQRKGNESINGETFADLKAALRRFFSGAIFPRYFYLPPLEGYFGSSVVDFQLLESRAFTPELFAQLETSRIATLRSSWKEALPVRFTTYAARIGVRDLSDYYIDSILKDYKLEFTVSA